MQRIVDCSLGEGERDLDDNSVVDLTYIRDFLGDNDSKYPYLSRLPNHKLLEFFGDIIQSQSSKAELLDKADMMEEFYRDAPHYEDIAASIRGDVQRVIH